MFKIRKVKFKDHEIQGLMDNADDTVHLCELVARAFGVDLTLSEATRMERYAAKNGLTSLNTNVEAFLQSCEGMFASLRDQGKLDKAVANGFIRDSKVLRKRLTRISTRLGPSLSLWK